MTDNFSGWLSRELEKRGMSQSDLARAAGVGTGSVSDVVSGRRQVGKNLAASIARGLDLPVDVVYRAAGFLPEETAKDSWVRRVEHKLARITDDRDREIIERTIDILSPDTKPKGAGRPAKNEGTS